MGLTVEFGGVALVLLPQRAAYVPETQALLVADAHFGKAHAFRSLGVPVPAGTTAENLAVLSALLAQTGARRLVFLGDLLHSARGRHAGTMQAVATWRAEHAAVAVTLVRGNHDSRAGDPPSAWGVEAVDEPWALGRLRLAHHPRAVPGGPVLAGHVHPAVVLRGAARSRLRAPCFHLMPGVGVLPAFGAFTGSHTVERGTGDRVFAIVEGAVVAV